MPLYENIDTGTNYAADSGWNNGIYHDRNRDYGQWMFGELAAENSDARTRALYNDLYSPQAQMEQLKAAGLSPSIFASGGIAGKSGVSGAMGSRGSSSTGGSQMFTNLFSAIAQATQIAANVSKTKAETDNLKAQTNQINAQTSNINQDTQNKGKEYKLLTAQIYESLANTEYRLIATKALDVQREIDEYTLKLAEYKWDNELSQEYADYEADNMYYTSMLTATQWDIAEKQLEYDKETLQERIQQVTEENKNLIKDTLLKASQIELTDKQATEVVANIITNWYSAKTYRLSAKAQNLWMKNQLILEYNKLELGAKIQEKQMNVSMINSFVGTLGNLVGMGMISSSRYWGGPTPKIGFSF